ncbi:carbonic anhydrase-related protein 10-like isoform X3 [Biomphalaria glabrata]|uniref:Carbonic anhydrase n=1 Tax=Biomphalaria glabrata TaxID=6526 RepID=A0A9W3A6S3_BIOGL|nr:carbonic anhydrase-related protein 10-like isoform X3 [Biomphalaria glabrata]
MKIIESYTLNTQTVIFLVWIQNIQNIHGPQHWGYLNPDWVLCQSGKFQSPINIEPRWLLYDPKLRRMSLDLPTTVNGTFKNAGNNLIFTLDTTVLYNGNFSDGPLLYTYKLSQVHIHIGQNNSHGSEHRIDGKSFAAEIHFVCYNVNLFKSLPEARAMPYGVAILAVFVEITQSSENNNQALSILFDKASSIPQQNQETRVHDFNLKALIPETNYYVTYEGSFTHPGCQETVTWVIINRPIFIRASQIDRIRFLQKRQIDSQMTLLEGNIRPLMPLNNRVVRTNINYHRTVGLCDMKRTSFYEGLFQDVVISSPICASYFFQER